MTLSVDIETYCDLDLQKVGVYRYAEHPSFEVLMIAYAYDDGPVDIVDLTPDHDYSLDYDQDFINKIMDLENDLIDPSITKAAWNANFERVCLASHFGQPMPPEQWRCSMVAATAHGLPRSLDKAAKALGVTEKMAEGKNLIRYFCKPAKPSSVNDQTTRNRPHHAPDKWAMFLEYCKRDVAVERAISAKVPALIDSEQELWVADQHINDRGMAVDMDLVDAAIAMDLEVAEEIKARIRELTGVDNADSLAQLKDWLETKGIPAHDMGLTKATMDEIAAMGDDEVKELMDLRARVSLASVKKYDAMRRSVCDDGRVRGLLQFGGASRTARWAGRLVQIQNLTKNKTEDVEALREVVKTRDVPLARALYGDVASTLSELVRTAFVAKEGHSFFVSDFSAIEARVIAWIAGESWRLDVFRTHGKIYEASASAMFGVPIEEITRDNPLRQKGKVAELALGYQGGPGALKSMGALNMGLEEEELRPLVDTWRKANPRIVSLWYALDRAAIEAVKTGMPTETHGIRFHVTRGILYMRLPSGRCLAYPQPRLKPGKFGNDQIHFKSDKWTDEDTYGGKLTENLVQATARDLLGHAIVELERAGYPVVAHVHDEVIVEAPDGTDLAEIDRIMGEGPPWAAGLPLGAEGFVSKFYMKD